MDVGANEGAYIEDVVATNEGANAFAFEPHPATYNRLLSRVSGLKNVTVINAACGRTAGQLALYDYAGSGGTEHASLHARVIEEIHKGKSDKHIVNVVILIHSQPNKVSRLLIC